LGLFFDIPNNGTKRWLCRFKLEGKNGMFSLFVDTQHQKAKNLASQGIKPTQVDVAGK